MNPVFVVTEHEPHSDRQDPVSVAAVFTTRALAEAYVAYWEANRGQTGANSDGTDKTEEDLWWEIHESELLASLPEVETR